MPCQIKPLLWEYEDVSKTLSIHNQMSYDLCLFIKLFAVGDKSNINVPYVANAKINNVVGTETYADSTTRNKWKMHFCMKKKTSKYIMRNLCNTEEL